MITIQDIKKVLQSIPQESPFQMEMVIEIIVQSDQITLMIEVPNHLQNQIPQLQADIHKVLEDIEDVKDIKILFTNHKPMNPPKKPSPSGKIDLPHIKNIIAVASGKGGVGKSTTAAYVALALKDHGLRVGLMDADIYGPSIPKIFDITEKPELKNGHLIPIQKMDLAIMSMGFLIDPEQPLIWRGPMVQTAIRQLLKDVAWGSLDALVIDMPPGTGDAHLTLSQSCPLTGAVIVTTPQDLALIDALKGIHMFQKTGVPILGLIENMSLYHCPNCNHMVPIFGEGGAQVMAKKLDVPFLGAIPLDMNIRMATDGHIANDLEKIQRYYEAIGKELMLKIMEQT